MMFKCLQTAGLMLNFKWFFFIIIHVYDDDKFFFFVCTFSFLLCWIVGR